MSVDAALEAVVRRDRLIVGDEIGGKGIVGVNAADPRGSEHHHVGARVAEPAFGLVLAGEIEGCALGGENLATLGRTSARDGGEPGTPLPAGATQIYALACA